MATQTRTKIDAAKALRSLKTDGFSFSRYGFFKFSFESGGVIYLGYLYADSTVSVKRESYSQPVCEFFLSDIELRTEGEMYWDGEIEISAQSNQ